jgi:Domain of unknown function (DUF4262)
MEILNNKTSTPDEVVVKNIEQYGWHVTLIRGEERSPGWAFSIGFYRSYGHPEVVVFGLPVELMRKVINAIGADVSAGKVFRSESAYSQILEGVSCIFQTVEKVWYQPFLGYARWFYQGDEFPVLQCIWPDKEQNFPGNAKFRSDWFWAQPLLFHADEDKANVKTILRSVRNAKHNHTDVRTESESSARNSHHAFSADEWPFYDPENTEAFTTNGVLQNKYPVLLVTHDDDGSWQVLCGTTNDAKDIRTACLGCLYEIDRTIGELADMPRGWEASRTTTTDPWQRRPQSPD